MTTDDRNQGKFQGWTEARINQLLDDVQELKKNMEDIRLWKAKVIGYCFGISASVSGICYIGTIFIQKILK